MQHIKPCAYCAGVVTMQDNRWVCTRCNAEWTLGMRLLREGDVFGKALDDVLGPNTPPDERLRVDTLHHAGSQRYRVRIYQDVVILTNLSGFHTVEDAGVLRAVRDIYALEDATYILHLPQDRPLYLEAKLGEGGTLFRVLAVEEVEQTAGIFLGDESELAEADTLWAEL